MNNKKKEQQSTDTGFKQKIGTYNLITLKIYHFVFQHLPLGHRQFTAYS